MATDVVTVTKDITDNAIDTVSSDLTTVETDNVEVTAPKVHAPGDEHNKAKNSPRDVLDNLIVTSDEVCTVTEAVSENINHVSHITVITEDSEVVTADSKVEHTVHAGNVIFAEGPSPDAIRTPANLLPDDGNTNGRIVAVGR